MQELPNQNNSNGYFLSTEQTTAVVLAHSQAAKREQKPTTKKFVCFHNHSPP